MTGRVFGVTSQVHVQVRSQLSSATTRAFDQNDQPSDQFGNTCWFQLGRSGLRIQPLSLQTGEGGTVKSAPPAIRSRCSVVGDDVHKSKKQRTCANFVILGLSTSLILTTVLHFH